MCEGIAVVMTLEESGSGMSIDVVSWDWRRIQSFVVDNEIQGVDLQVVSLC